MFQEQFKNFKKTEDENDFVDEEKQKIVLMSIILLTFIKKKTAYLQKQVPDLNIYHNPLMLTLVNSVSANDSDLYLFFKELQKIACNQFSNDLFEDAKKHCRTNCFQTKMLHLKMKRF